MRVPVLRQLPQARTGAYASTNMTKVTMAFVAALAVYASVNRQQAPRDEPRGESRL